jgi:hypothetical protein
LVGTNEKGWAAMDFQALETRPENYPYPSEFWIGRRIFVWRAGLAPSIGVWKSPTLKVSASPATKCAKTFSKNTN